MPNITSTMNFNTVEATLTTRDGEQLLSDSVILAAGTWTLGERTFPETITVANLKDLLRDTDVFNSVVNQRFAPPKGILADHELLIEREVGELRMRLKFGLLITRTVWSAPVGVTMRVRPALAGSWADWLYFIEAHRQLYNLIKAVGG